MTIFGKSCDLKTKTPKTQAACIFLRWNKFQKVECIQMQKLTYGYVEMYFIEKVMTSQKLLACVAGGISCASAFVLVAKP